MIISLVTGTYNRLPYLQAMVHSFTAQIPRHIPYEIILVDGGSTDGTLEWARAREDVRLIEHGELRGAIRAFCDGARAAVGDYVLLANDDVLFLPFSVMRAVSYLEDTRTCGAVAFADNRSAQLGYANERRVEQAPGILPDGQKTMFNYAQVGMFRRWLGNAAGWWGDTDEVMGQARTYGGDNYLSSRVWELGYTVDAVAGCAIDDQIVRDTLRTSNNASGKRDSELYYLRFPQGPRFPGVPQIPNDQSERLRVMVLPIYEARFPARMNKEYGLSEALASVGLAYEIDYNNEAVDIPAAVRAWQPNLILTQIHGASKRINAHILSLCRDACPNAVIVNWCGDAHEAGLLDPAVIDCLRLVDLQTVVNARVLPRYKELGIRAAFWQIAWKAPIEPLPSMPKHDVVFLGNCYSARRFKIAETLKTIPASVGIYGNCPGAEGNTHYSFAASAALYQNAKIAISDVFPGTTAFVSNRLFQALGAGAFVLQEHSPRLDEFTGLCAGEHFIEWHKVEELPDLIREWLRSSHRKDRQRIARAGMEFVRREFNYDRQVEKLFELL